MIRGLMCAGLVLAGAASAWAFGHGGADGPPTQQLVRVDSSGRMKVFYQVQVCIPETAERTVQKQVPVTKQVQEEVNGEVRTKEVIEYQTVQEAVTYTVMKTVCETKVRDLDLGKVKAFETDGRSISPEKLASRLTEDTLVLVSANDQMIPDYYAGLFKQGTIVLAFEPIAYPVEAAPLPPPGAAPPAPGAAPQQAEAIPLRRISQPGTAEEGVELRVPESALAPDFPSTLAPMFVYASRNGAEEIKLRQTSQYSYEVTGHLAKRKGTGKQMMPVLMTQTNRNTQITAISGKYVQFFSGNGSLIPLDHAKEKLSREATVLYSADGEEVDPFWLQNVKASSLVLVGPQLPQGCGPGMSYGGGYAAPMPVPVFPSAPVEAVPQPPQAAPQPGA